MNAFEFATAQRIIFGAGKVRELAAAAKAFGSRALVVCGQNPVRARLATDLIEQSGVMTASFAVSGEPDVAVVQRGADFAREQRAELIVGFGGGSVLDAAKAIAALATNGGDAFDYLEVIGRAQPLRVAPLPIIALPTTAGTGSEVTRNAVLASIEHRVKVSLRHPGMLPRVAIVDPELTLDLPPRLTASTGMDALTQLVEPFVSARANPLTDAICREAIPKAAVALPRAFSNGADAEARHDMALASLFGGLALANSGLGAVHGFAAPIGGMFPAPHGAVCAALLAEVIDANCRVARRLEAHATLGRYDEVARMLMQQPAARAADAVTFVRDLASVLGIPTLRQFGIQPADLATVAEKAAQSSSMKGNPVPLSRDELIEILQRAW